MIGVDCNIPVQTLRWMRQFNLGRKRILDTHWPGRPTGPAPRWQRNAVPPRAHW
jgi:hypothetical protein